MEGFNLRVYGWVMDPIRGVLLSEERGWGREFIKFPGGGVDLGEGPLEALKREFMEEMQISIPDVKPFYVTQECVPSSFDSSQVVGIYYEIPDLAQDTLTQLARIRDMTQQQAKEEFIDYQRLFWESDIHKVADLLSFEMDRKAWKAYIRP